MVSSINKNRFKKTYGYERVTPALANVLIAGTTESILIDRNIIKVDRQFYLLAEAIDSSYTIPTPSTFGEYEEDDYDVAAFSEVETITFTTPFSSTPIVVAQTNVSTNDLYNINLYVDSVSNTDFTVKFSSAFSGSIRYRAIYNSSYPTVVERTPLFPGTYYTASADIISLTNEDQKTITYPSLGAAPTELFLTPQDASNDETAQVFVTMSLGTSIGNTSSDITVSTPLSNQINFIVAKS